MSAIDTTFTWVRNPTAINGLATTYVSKRGSDTTGNGTAQNPYASIAKATSVATAGTNIMLDDYRWSEQRTLNKIAFRWWGNGKCELNGADVAFTNYDGDYFHNFSRIINYVKFNGKFFDCTVIGNGTGFNGEATHCILYRITDGAYYGISSPENCVCINTISITADLYISTKKPVNNIFIGTALLPHTGECDYNNYTTGSIPTNNGGNVHSINNVSTGQTLADYFNYIHPNCLANPTTASVDEWLQCDFTAKSGSANIGRGKNGKTIGFNQGFTMYANNSADSVFKVSNGATLKNIEWNSTLNGYTLIQKERVCQGATASTIALDSSASSVDDYYNNLFGGIVGGDGYGEIFKIIDYDGATKTATIDGIWSTTPNTNSIYTISGTIFSATKDLGKVIKVKRNWTFADSFTTLADGRWAEFLTNLTSQGKELPVSCFLYEYSVDGTTWVQGHTADDLVSATNGGNKVTNKIYGDCSPNYVEASAKELIMRYIRVNVHIGFNI